MLNGVSNCYDVDVAVSQNDVLVYERFELELNCVSQFYSPGNNSTDNNIRNSIILNVMPMSESHLAHSIVCLKNHLTFSFMILQATATRTCYFHITSGFSVSQMTEAVELWKQNRVLSGNQTNNRGIITTK